MDDAISVNDYLGGIGSITPTIRMIIWLLLWENIFYFVSLEWIELTKFELEVSFKYIYHSEVKINSSSM